MKAYAVCIIINWLTVNYMSVLSLYLVEKAYSDKYKLLKYKGRSGTNISDVKTVDAHLANIRV